MSTTYIRDAYKKVGLDFYSSDIKRISNPMSSYFSFTIDKKNVVVESAKDVLPPFYYQKLLKRHKEHPILPCTCHTTAGEVAYLLRDLGVEVCDGCYVFQGDGLSRRHTFCKLGDRYFDPTIEFAYSFGKTQNFEYISERVFNAKEYTVLQHAFGFLYAGQHKKLVYMPTMWAERPDGFVFDYYLSDDGYIEKMEAHTAIAA